jgi:hypothetical protein
MGAFDTAHPIFARLRRPKGGYQPDRNRHLYNKKAEDNQLRETLSATFVSRREMQHVHLASSLAFGKLETRMRTPTGLN